MILIKMMEFQKETSNHFILEETPVESHEFGLTSKIAPNVK
jgi:hypothetical protein